MADLARCRAVRPRLSVKFTLIIFLLVLMRMTKMIVKMTLMMLMGMTMARMVVVVTMTLMEMR